MGSAYLRKFMHPIKAERNSNALISISSTAIGFRLEGIGGFSYPVDWLYFSIYSSRTNGLRAFMSCLLFIQDIRGISSSRLLSMHQGLLPELAQSPHLFSPSTDTWLYLCTQNDVHLRILEADEKTHKIYKK